MNYFILVLLLFSFNCFSQDKTSFKIYYSLTLNEDFIKEKSEKSSNSLADKYMSKFFKDLRIITKDSVSIYRLDYLHGNYNFKYVERMTINDKDSPLLEKANYHGYNNTKNLLGFHNFRGSKLKVMHDVKKWNIHNEFTTILGFKCQKATYTFFYNDKSFKTIAWFTKELPPTSLFQFLGLPGTILKLEKSFEIYTATLIEFDNIDVEIIDLNNIENIISEDEFHKMLFTKYYR
jgi:GLPGLI family protein